MRLAINDFPALSPKIRHIMTSSKAAELPRLPVIQALSYRKNILNEQNYYQSLIHDCRKGLFTTLNEDPPAIANDQVL